MSPYFLKYGGRNLFCPPTFRGTNPYYVADLLKNDCFSSPIKHNNAQLNAIKNVHNAFTIHLYSMRTAFFSAIE